MAINYLEEKKVQKPQKIRKGTKSRKEEVKELFLKEKLPIKAIATMLGVSENLVKEDLLMLGIDPLVPQRLPSKQGVDKQAREPKAKKTNHEKTFKTGNKRLSTRERRIQIARLYREGTEIEEIYQIFSNVSTRIIDRDIMYIEENGITGNESTEVGKSQEEEKQTLRAPETLEGRETIVERRKKVIELYGTMSAGKIAEILGVSKATIDKDISFLKKEGFIISYQGENIKNRREKVARLYGTMSTEKIARKLGVTKSTINSDIRALIKSGIIIDESEEEAEKRRKIIARMYGKKYISEIAEELGVSMWQVNRDIKILKQQGVIKSEEIRDRVSQKKKEEQKERREKILELFGEMNNKDIARTLGVSINTVVRDIEILRREGRLADRTVKGITSKGKQEEIRLRREMITRLYGKITTREMAKRFNVSIATINNDIRFLKSKGAITSVIRVKRNRYTRMDKEEREERRQRVLELYGKYSLTEISKMLNIPYGVIYNDIKVLIRRGEIGELMERQDESEEIKPEGEKEEIEYMLSVKNEAINLYKQGKVQEAIEILEKMMSRITITEEKKKIYEEIMQMLQEKLEQKVLVEKSTNDEQLEI